ncbi:MAG: metalloregulator ArsR/SmtB family transcription factor [Deltaproteobacteria bacterium]|nr:metalloregulator ArsR/SmtB family transcription factor [Deltaproteobacteria bacterium]
MRRLAGLFKALSDETRLQMLGLLIGGKELCVCDFIKVLKITQSKASRHLRHLTNAGLLDDRRDSVWVYYRIVDNPGKVHAKIIEILPSIIKERMPPELFDHLADWKKSRERSEGSCKDIPAKSGTKVNKGR